MWRNLSVRLKIAVVLLGVLALAVLVQTFYITPRIVQHSIEQQNAFQREIARQINAGLDSVFAQARSELESIAALPGIKSLEKGRMDRIIQNRNATDAFFNYYFVMDRSGRWLSYPGREALVGKRIPRENMAWVNHAFNRRQTVFLDVLPSRIDTLVSGFASPIPADSGKPRALLRGVIVVSKRNRARELIRDTRVGKNGYVYVVSRKGHVIAHPRRTVTPERFTEMDYSAYPPVQQIMRGQSGIRQYTYEGRQWVAAYCPNPTTGWGIIAHQPLEDILAAARTRARNIWPLLTIATVASILLIGLVIRFTLKPLNWLLHDLETGSPEAGSMLQTRRNWPRDEIGKLGRRFETLYTDLVRRSEELRKSEENLRITLNSIGDAVVATDTKGAITRMNPVAEALTGWPLESAAGLDFSEVFTILHGQTREKLKSPAAEILAKQHPKELAGPTLLVAKDGSEHQISDSGAPIRDREGNITGVVLVFRDVTEQYRMQQELRRKEEQMKLALQGADLGTWDWNVQTGETAFNERWAHMLGYALDEIKPRVRTWSKLVHPDDAADAEQRMQAHLKGETDFYESEHRLQHKDGRWIWMLGKGRVIERDASGRALRACGTHLDITKRKQTENELLKMQKLESIGTLAGGIAHDFNNLLMALFGNIQMAKSSLPPESYAAEALTESEQAMDQAIRLTRQLLTFSRGGAPVLEVVDIGRMVEETVRFDLSGSQVKPLIEYPEDLWHARADKGQVQQVISNLVINAAQAMAGGGCLHVCLSNAETGHGEIAGLAPGRYVRVAIRDEGSGIDPKHLEKIFDPYFTTKQAGSGLGLATAYSIISRHNGHISVASRQGEGTTFTFYLPASDDKPASKTKAPEQTALSQPKTRSADRSARVLVMDDQAMIRDLITQQLEKGGYSAAAAADGEQAVAAYKAAMDAGRPFDLVIMDLTIPGGKGGKEAVREILDLDPSAKCIVSSGYASDPIMADAQAYGFKAAIGKPYTRGNLLAVIEQVLAS